MKNTRQVLRKLIITQSCNSLKIQFKNLIYKIHIFPKCVKCLDNKKCWCTFLTHFEKNLVLKAQVSWFGPKFNVLWKKKSMCIIFSKCIATYLNNVANNAISVLAFSVSRIFNLASQHGFSNIEILGFNFCHTLKR